MTDKLENYRRKRDFRRTGEPSGAKAAPAGRLPRFVIQHHLARADHYDLRLEISGVLVSWAVPKGPSLDPRERRLAKRTEDHPMDYQDFEGVIGSGRYGGGVVQVWDRGTFENLSHHGDEALSADEGLERGHLTFRLDGQKIGGAYSLFRTRGDNQWLLIKKRDGGADARRRPTGTQTASVLTGRSMDEIAAQGRDT